MLLSGRSIASWLGPVRRRCFSSSFLDTKTRLEYDTVIEWTQTDGTDWDHLEVHHLSRSHDIPGRPAFILGHESRNPGEGMGRTAKALAASAAANGKRVVIGVPCNTFHHHDIWQRYSQIAAELPNVTLVHLIDEAVIYTKQVVPNLASVGVLCTTATKEAAIFDAPFAEQGVEVVYADERDQEELQESISSLEYGLKAVFPPSPRATGTVHKIVNKFQEQGVGAIFMGCTEMPLVLHGTAYNGTPLVDPVDALARALIREVDPAKVKPL